MVFPWCRDRRSAERREGPQQEPVCTHTLNNHRACSVAMFLSLAQRWRLDQDMSEVSTNPGTNDRCIIVPLEDSVRLTPKQAVYRGEFFTSEETCTCNQPLVILLPVATSRVRLVCFDAVVDCHSDSDIENVQAQKKAFLVTTSHHAPWWCTLAVCLRQSVVRNVVVPVRQCLGHVVPLVPDLRECLVCEVSSGLALCLLQALVRIFMRRTGTTRQTQVFRISWRRTPLSKV